MITSRLACPQSQMSFRQSGKKCDLPYYHPTVVRILDSGSNKKNPSKNFSSVSVVGGIAGGEMEREEVGTAGSWHLLSFYILEGLETPPKSLPQKAAHQPSWPPAIFQCRPGKPSFP